MKSRRKTLKKSILAWTIPFILLVCIIMSAVQFFGTRKVLYARYESYIENILRFVEGEIDTDDLAECMRTGIESEKYHELQKFLDKCRDRMNIHFLYVIEPLNTEPVNNIRNVIAGASKEEYETIPDQLVYLNMPTGNSYSPETAAKYLDAYRTGRLSFFEEISEWGDDYTGFLPLYDSKGNKVAALCVDVDIAEIHTILKNEALVGIGLIMLIGVSFIVIFMLWIVRNVTDPIEQLERCVTDLASRCRNQKDPEALRIDVPEIRTDNEVETLAHAVSEMSEAMQDYVKSMAYTHIAQTLARGYTDLFYVNMETEEYIEYQTGSENGALSEKRRGNDFFDSCKREANIYVYPDDRNNFVRAMDKGTLNAALGRSNSFMMSYRLITDKAPAYVNMKVSRMEDDERYIIVGITDIDEQVKQRRYAERLSEERIAYTRINALAGDFLCIYVIAPQSGFYREYSATDGFESFSLPKEGMDFFATAREMGRKLVYPGDLERYLSVFTKENVLAEIERSGIFSMTYRLIVDGKPTYVQLRGAMVEEKDGPRLIIGLNDIDAHVRQEEEYEKRIAQAQREANRDALTGVKNKHAYLNAEDEMDRRISKHRAPEFAVVILDINGLKRINDTYGHQAGDKYIKDACRIICDIFKRSPVFRVGGDEFAVIAQGKDYECIEELMGRMKDHNNKALEEGGIVIAGGMSKFDNDICVAAVFERADQKMYENKNDLKTKGHDGA